MRIGAVTVIGCRCEGSATSGAISTRIATGQPVPVAVVVHCGGKNWGCLGGDGRSEEHTSELQSLRHLVCRLLLEKKTNSIGQQCAGNKTRTEYVCNAGAAAL